MRAGALMMDGSLQRLLVSPCEGLDLAGGHIYDIMDQGTLKYADRPP